MDREVKRLKKSCILIIKVRWNSRRGLEFTWEHEDQFRKKYPHLFTKTAPSTKNGNSWVFVPQTTQENGTSVTKMSVPVTAKEKTNKKKDVKARSLLLMALSNEHQLTFNWYTNAKTMFAAIEIRFGVWMNKAEIETISIDDLYNNFKIVEQSVKKSVSASSGAQNLAFMTAPSTNSTNDDLEQIHKDDLEVMDLKWQLSLLSMRAKRAPRNKEGQFRNQDNTRKQGNNEDTSSKAILVVDGVGFDWSDMAEEQVQTNMALMAFSDSEVYNDKTCSKTCLKNYETLKKQCDDLIVKLNQTEFTAATYKRGLATIEEQLITYRKNEFEKVKQEKEGIEFKIEKFDKASKDLDKLLGSQITDKSKKGLGYNVVPPSHPLIYNRPKKLDLSYSGLNEFKAYGSEDKQVSKDSSSFLESSLNVDKETVFPVDKKVEFVKPKNHENPVKKSVRLIVDTIKGKGWNMVPRAVLMKTGLKPFNTARPKAVKTARPNSAVVNAVRGKPQQ
ncbi:hypothetical protein Tco_0918487, partial [Tanacetum coccineum]